MVGRLYGNDRRYTRHLVITSIGYCTTRLYSVVTNTLDAVLLALYGCAYSLLVELYKISIYGCNV